ncbi:hypothetical protein RN001_005314 [Aquatica leii]|uniref:Complex III assembly factor LYRM7 n=1 Tax=Aquatica leii TaxID=1421715 RepID=A0AAN7P6E7_9COLE|nr:hypothetical protein RN001_005314 [Aquatica leii]
MSTLRLEVLKCFKSLHRTRQRVFEGDVKALVLGRSQINIEYKKNQDIKDINKINKLIETSMNVEKELLTTVIQAKEIKPGVYKAEIRPEILRLDNVPYKDCDELIDKNK